jgi:hypothetical protein
MRYPYYAESEPETMVLPHSNLAYQTIRRVWFQTYEESQKFLKERAHQNWVLTHAVKPLEWTR